MSSPAATWLRWGGAALAGALIASGAYSGAGALAQHSVTESARVLEPTSALDIDASGDITITLDPAARSITIRPSARTGFSALHLGVDRTESRARVTYSCPAQVAGSCEGSLAVSAPPTAQLRASTRSGRIAVMGALAAHDPTAMSLATSSGSIRVLNVVGSLTARSASGNVSFESVTGDVSVRTASGNIRGTAPPGAPAAALDIDSPEVLAASDPRAPVKVSLHSDTGLVRYEEYHVAMEPGVVIVESPSDEGDGS